jgi:predicted Zn finger-like uncharacterized protein
VFTQCPDCGTVFRVTATVLRAARGQVRCGVCDATFDALQYLTEEPEVESDTGELPQPDAASSPDAPAVGGVGEPTPDEFDEDDDEADGAPDEPSDAETEERILDAAYASDGLPADTEFPLEQLDDPIDVIAQPGTGPRPEFPPFEPEEPAFADDSTTPAAARADDAEPLPPPSTADSGHFEIALEELDAAPESAPEPAPFAPFERRAGRNTPSADEDRAIAEIAAALARRAQSTPPSMPAAAGGDEDVRPLEIELLDASDAENIVLSGDEDVSDAALEFNLPAEEWDRVFVPDATAATIPPLDPDLARARDEAMREPPTAAAAPPAASTAVPPAAAAPSVAASSDDLEIDFDLDVETDDEDDGDLDDADLRERARPVAAAPEDPLSRTDEFPPLRVTLAEEAAAGLADTPAAKPRTGVAPDDFDALVAAAAARAAAEVAARVGAPPASAAANGANLRSPPPTDAPFPMRASAAFGDAPADASDGGAENAWFTARRDLAPEGAAIADLESPESIQFDAQRFQAIVRGRPRRPWWRTALYAAGSLALLLALGVQAVHYWRESLAQDPMFGPPVREAYARLGLPVEPRWNLAAYDVKQWGATSDVAPGTLRVRASIVNRAARAQPHPLLRVTLLDRFSAKVARREFLPAEYLPGRSAPADLLPAGARVDADLVIADPGSEAVGFELDVCLKRKGVLECAGDAKLAVQ